MLGNLLQFGPMKTATDDGTYLPANADSLARLHTAEAMGKIVEIMRGDEIGCPKLAALQLKAAETILDRGHGRAVQAVISVPARAAVAAKLAAMSDADLMQIAKRGRGSTSETGDPTHPATGAVPSSQMPTAFKKLRLHDAEVLDADIDIDPCS